LKQRFVGHSAAFCAPPPAAGGGGARVIPTGSGPATDATTKGTLVYDSTVEARLLRNCTAALRFFDARRGCLAAREL